MRYLSLIILLLNIIFLQSCWIYSSEYGPTVGEEEAEYYKDIIKKHTNLKELDENIFYYVYISNGDIEQFALCHDKIKICGERSYGDIINETYYLSEKYVYNSTLNVYESIPFTKSLSSSRRNDIIEKATTSLKSLIANIDKKDMYEIVYNNGVPFYTNDGDYFVDLSKQNNNLTIYPSTEYTSIDPYTLGTFVLSYDFENETNEINSYKVYYYYSEEYDSNETEYPGWGEIEMLDIYNS